MKTLVIGIVPDQIALASILSASNVQVVPHRKHGMDVVMGQPVSHANVKRLPSPGRKRDAIQPVSGRGQPKRGVGANRILDKFPRTTRVQVEKLLRPAEVHLDLTQLFHPAIGQINAVNANLRISRAIEITHVSGIGI